MTPLEAPATTHRSPSDTACAIETQGLTKRFGELTAVDALDLSVRQGEVYGFLGRNGAGKTTTIRMLLGLIRPTRGRTLLFGNNVATQRIAAVTPVGSLVETATSYPTLTVRENLEIQRRLSGAPADSVAWAADLLGLSDLTARRAGHLSLGNKQRLALARTILHRPRLLVLDEPANGLDPAGIVEIRLLLRRLATEEGVTVFVSSHILSEVAQLADRIGIIHLGRMVEEIDPRTASDGAPGRIELLVSDPKRAQALLAAIAGVVEVRLRDDRVLEIVPGEVRASTLARLVVEAGLEIDAFVPIREDLEARFLRLTGGRE